MKKLPVGRQNFKAIIEEDLLYVDKTQQVFNLIDNGRLYFMARPRRFGKSLLVSLFTYLFSGEKELFENLYIGQHTDYDFQAYPVLQFNFADFGFKVKDLEIALSKTLDEYARAYGVSVSDVSIALKFKSLVQNIVKKEGKPIVLLIDEYDKPIADFFRELDKASANRLILRQFFGPLKGLESKGYLRFLFITGVSKFSKVSLFSDLNNLTDLSIHSFSNDLAGITQQELLHYFEAYITVTANKFALSKSAFLGAVKNWYNGYSFDGVLKLYNPFSLLRFFQNQQFSNYWFSTGTPTFLVETIRDKGIDPQEFEDIKVSDTFLNKFSLRDLNMAGLLFQTGYLTIKERNANIYETRYLLGYPNLEVRKSMMYHLVEAFTFKPSSLISEALFNMQDGLKEGNLSLFIGNLKIILSDLKYNWQPPKQYKTQAEVLKMWEGYFHAILYLITSYMDMFVQAEIAHHKGRLDLIAKTEDYIYLMEFKMDGAVENAIAQIKDRAYAMPYENSSKKVILVGINFSNEERNVESWKSEVWE